jgi:hypothetical protein
LKGALLHTLIRYRKREAEKAEEIYKNGDALLNEETSLSEDAVITVEK